MSDCDAAGIGIKLFSQIKKHKNYSKGQPPSIWPDSIGRLESNTYSDT
jgi:hypothetical protein